MGGFIGDLAEDLGKAVEKNVTKPIVGGVKDVGKFIQEEVIDPVADFGSSLEEAVRDAADDVNKVIENPYVQAIVTAINPAAGSVLSAYATLNSGDELSEGQIIALAAAGYSVGSGVKLSPEVTKAIDVGTTVAEGGDVKDALISAYGGDFAKELGLDVQVQSGLSNIVGSDLAQKISNNIDINQASADIVAGTSPERILANQFGDEVVSYLGAETPTQQALGYAGIESLISKAEGASDEDALLAGAKTYYNRGGRLPSVNEIAGIAGIDAGDFKFDLGDFGINVPDLPLDFDLRGLAGRGFDLSNIPFPELEARGFSLPEIRDLGIDISGLQFPDLQARGFGLGDIGDLGFDIGSMDFSGFRPGDLGDYSLPELKDMGVNIGDLNLDLELGGLGVALAGAEQQQREQLAEEEELLDGTAQFQPEFSEIEGPSFAREVLGRRFT